MSSVTARTHYEKYASLRCDAKLFHSPGQADAKVLSPKVSWVRVRFSLKYERHITGQRPMHKQGNLELVAGRRSFALSECKLFKIVSYRHPGNWVQFETDQFISISYEVSRNVADISSAG